RLEDVLLVDLFLDGLVRNQRRDLEEVAVEDDLAVAPVPAAARNGGRRRRRGGRLRGEPLPDPAVDEAGGEEAAEDEQRPVDDPDDEPAHRPTEPPEKPAQYNPAPRWRFLAEPSEIRGLAGRLADCGAPAGTTGSLLGGPRRFADPPRSPDLTRSDRGPRLRATFSTRLASGMEV